MPPWSIAAWTSARPSPRRTSRAGAAPYDRSHRSGGAVFCGTLSGGFRQGHGRDRGARPQASPGRRNHALFPCASVRSRDIARGGRGNPAETRCAGATKAAALHAELARLDPVAAAGIRRATPQRFSARSGDQRPGRRFGRQRADLRRYSARTCESARARDSAALYDRIGRDSKHADSACSMRFVRCCARRSARRPASMRLIGYRKLLNILRQDVIGTAAGSGHSHTRSRDAS